MKTSGLFVKLLEALNQNEMSFYSSMNYAQLQTCERIYESELKKLMRHKLTTVKKNKEENHPLEKLRHRDLMKSTRF